MSITLWKPEPDVLIHQALGKACEEASELANILARCLIQGLDQREPVSGKPNRKALSDEIADLDAAVQWLRELTGEEYDEERADRKLRGFRQWQRMLEADRALSPSPEPNLRGDGEAAIIECLAAGEAFVFDPATNFLHADDGTVEGGIRYVPASQEQRVEYRLLCDGEIVRRGDQPLNDDCVSWGELVGWEVGIAYYHSVFVPIRRALTTEGQP
jgi:hypothetical protein